MIAIINYDAGNLKSVQNALDFLDKKYFVANTPEKLNQASLIILPGVGAAKPAMEKLNTSGFAKYIKHTEKPVLGICLGMQLLADFSEEGEVACLGVIPGKVKKFSFNTPLTPTLSQREREKIKIPHMGWNTVNTFELKTQNLEQLYYFVHSYYFDTTPQYTIATCEYGIEFPAIVQNKNFTGMQFHPEKSGQAGLQLLHNWIEKNWSG